MQYPLIPFKETNDRLSQYIFDLKDDRNLNLYMGLKKHLMKLSLLKQGHKNRRTILFCSNTEDIDLQHLFVMKSAIPHQKHLKVREP